MTEVIGTVASDSNSPTFELVRIKLKAGRDVKPGTLVKIPVNRSEKTALIGRVSSGHEDNPHERPEDIAVRDALGLHPNHPNEEHSTSIIRSVEADLIEEIFEESVESSEENNPAQPTTRRAIRAPQSLPNPGAEVSIASGSETVFALGLVETPEQGIHIGRTTSGSETDIVLKRESIQRHFFICGTTGSGKSYAMGVLAEELIEKHHLPVVFLDTQDEYSALVRKLGGEVVSPGVDFSIRISSLTESELLDLLPAAMKTSPLQMDVVAKAFGELKSDIAHDEIAKFTLDDLLRKIDEVAPQLVAKEGDVPRVADTAKRRTETLRFHRIFGDGIGRADWRKKMYPCMSINCKHLTGEQLQTVATAVLRELQNLRLKGHIPPYAMVIDEAHLFVPNDSGSPCKQIIREGVRIGRHHGICMVLLTQSPIDIDKSVIRQCNTRLVFALEPDQLDAIRGVKADATDEMLASLSKMPQGTCLLSGTYESVKHTIPVKIRLRRTKDSQGGETPDIFMEMKDKWLAAISQLKGEGV